jgi:hypothetical protein
VHSTVASAVTAAAKTCRSFSSGSVTWELGESILVLLLISEPADRRDVVEFELVTTGTKNDDTEHRPHT